MTIKLLVRYFTFFYEIFEIITCASSVQSKPQSAPAMCQVLGSHMWLVATTLVSSSLVYAQMLSKRGKADVWLELVLEATRASRTKPLEDLGGSRRVWSVVVVLPLIAFLGAGALASPHSLPRPPPPPPPVCGSSQPVLLDLETPGAARVGAGHP